MSQPKHLVPTLVLLGLVTLAPGCGDAEDDHDHGATAATTTSSSSSGSGGGGTGGGGTGGGGTGGAAPQSIEVAFEARVGDAPFSCAGAFTGLGAAATDVNITDFRMYVHGFELHEAASGSWVPLALTQDNLFQYQDLALLDFEDKTGSCSNGTSELNTKVRGTAPEGSYDGVRFKLGVPFELNHADVATAPSPLNLSGLFWNWQGGYKFLRVDSVPVGGGSPFNLHLGSTGCDGDPATGGVTACDRPNVTQVELSSFDLAAGTIIADYAAVVADNDLTTDAGGAPGCMAGVTDPECAPVFNHLGMNIADGTLTPETLDFFRAE